jgi:hypothetical protein
MTGPNAFGGVCRADIASGNLKRFPVDSVEIENIIRTTVAAMAGGFYIRIHDLRILFGVTEKHV